MTVAVAVAVAVAVQDAVAGRRLLARGDAARAALAAPGVDRFVVLVGAPVGKVERPSACWSAVLIDAVLVDTVPVEALPAAVASLVVPASALSPHAVSPAV